MIQFVGKVDVPRYEMPNVKVRSDGTTAILTFDWEAYSRDGELTSRWSDRGLRSQGRSVEVRAHLHWAPIIAR